MRKYVTAPEAEEVLRKMDKTFTSTEFKKQVLIEKHIDIEKSVADILRLVGCENEGRHSKVWSNSQYSKDENVLEPQPTQQLKTQLNLLDIETFDFDDIDIQVLVNAVKRRGYQVAKMLYF